MNPEVKGLWGAEGFLCRVVYLKHNIAPGTSSMLITILKMGSGIPVIISPILPKRDLTFKIQKVRKGRSLKGEEFSQMMLIGEIVYNIGVIWTSYVHDKVVDDMTDALNIGGNTPQGFRPVGNSSIIKEVKHTKILKINWLYHD